MNIYNEFRKTAINRYSKTALVMMNDEGETKEYTFGQTLQPFFSIALSTDVAR